jgi:DUF1016 N-terminal domain
LFFEIKNLIETSKSNVAVTVNSEMKMLYWNIGKRVNDEVLQNNSAEYSKHIVVTLARQLEIEYGKWWSEKQLRHCLRKAETISDFQIVSTLRRQLSWSHIKMLIPIENDSKRMFYIEMCKLEKWSSRQLQERINLLSGDSFLVLLISQ